ncbi:MAG: DNA-3-methyladenine glycosylase I [Betaproteobacteria bacterium]|nr:DNA-3-methyladenine glycosylase I [Betaproteobacteria bacterium]
MKRCPWARHPLAIGHHDSEWGVPVKNDRKHLQPLILEGAQSGLCRDTILAKRAHYRRAFDGLHPSKRGFNFASSTSIYAFMQAVGMVQDQAVGCLRRKAGGA